MKKGFPYKFLWIPIGWKDLGKVDSTSDPEKVGYVVFDSCSFCNRRVNIGIEDHKVFKFCPRCLVMFKYK